ncbi:MAG: hypothetical protein ACREQ9_09735, partial [Candidatus Binatia bacterium]
MRIWEPFASSRAVGTFAVPPEPRTLSAPVHGRTGFPDARRHRRILPMIDDADVDELFTLPPEEFTAARNRLARQAKQEGRMDLAIRLAGLRKPTAVVWIANQIARRHPDDVAQLLEAARALRQAQEGALRGGKPAAVGAETAEWRRSLNAVVRRGREIARSSGRRSFDEARLTSRLLGAAARD